MVRNLQSAEQFSNEPGPRRIILNQEIQEIEFSLCTSLAVCPSNVAKRNCKLDGVSISHAQVNKTLATSRNVEIEQYLSEHKTW